MLVLKMHKKQLYHVAMNKKNSQDNILYYCWSDVVAVMVQKICKRIFLWVVSFINSIAGRDLKQAVGHKVPFLRS